ncbi:MAG TPA: NAD(P)/FAD-dependent oxidoreductase [Thermomicrobiales bacterium]|nr:NAD(P)/FAD-dependent oxidoreductase [Thermomicrobiales bacterium]
MKTNAPTSPLDVLVIGAGQAGLALGYHLRQTGQSFLIVDRVQRVGESWRQRFDSLTLFTPRAYSALPGLPVPGDPDGFPTKDETADYLEAYARHFTLPLTLGTEIVRLDRADGLFTATTTEGRTLTARAVVIATGAFQQPVIPPISERLAPDVTQLTAEIYRNPRQVPAGTVLVVGDGATGRQIARELNATHRVLLATGRSRRVSAHRILGKSVFWWMDKLGVLRKSRGSRLGRRLRETDPFPGKDLALDKLREEGITVAGRLTGVNGRRVMFSDATLAEIATVIWAAGYRDRTEWVAIPEAKDEHGAFIEHRGISPVPGLAFIGRSWQWTRGSALLTGVGADAAYVVEHLASLRDGHPVRIKEMTRGPRFPRYRSSSSPRTM